MSSWQLSALELAAAVLLAIPFAGCSKSDGSSEIAEGREAFDSGDWGKAAKELEKGLESCDKDVDAILLLARAKLAVGELAAANEALAKAEMLAADDVDVIQLGAQIAYHGKDYAKARKAYERLANDKKLEAKLRSIGWAGIGVIAMTDNEFDTARIAFYRAINADRHNASAYYHLGLLYRNAFGYNDASLDQFEKFAYLGDGADERVRKVQRKIIPELKDAIAKRSSSIPGVDKRDSAACSATISKAEAAMKRGTAKEIKSARQLYERAMTEDPLSYPAALGLAKAWQKDNSKLGQQKTMEAYRKACELRPGSVQTFLDAGSLATKLGYHAQAVEIYSRAVAADFTSPSALDGLVRSLRKAGGARQKYAQEYQNYRSSLPAKKRR